MKYKTELLENSAIQLIDGDRGKNYPKQADFREQGYCLFLSAKNVTLSGFEFSETSFIDKEKENILRAGKLQRGDIVLTTRGTIGNIAFYGDEVPFEHVRINSGMMIFRADENRWNLRFLYFLLTSNFVRQQIESLTSGSAVPQLPARDLKKFQLPNIPRDIQDFIEKIIGDIADKIALNTQTNQTLEAIAQAIFKSWFVDFEPVKAKMAALESGGTAEEAERAAMCAISGKDEATLIQLQTEQPDAYAELAQTAALFPSAMQDLDFGGIPEGWEVQELSNLAKLNAKSWSSKTAPEFIEYVDLANTKMGVIQDTQKHEFSSSPSRARRILRIDDTLIGTVRPGNGSFAFIKSDDLTGSTGFAVLSPMEKVFSEFIYICATRDENIQRLAHLADGGAYPAVKPEVIARTQCILPENTNKRLKVLDAYHHVTSNLFLKREFNFKENTSLAELRDTLLPKLLSGEIDLSQVADMADEVSV